MSDTIMVKPNPAEPANIVLRHPVSGGLVDAAGKVPEAGRPWLYDGFTCRLLTDRAILRADDPVFAVAPAPADPAPAQATAAQPQPAPAKPDASPQPAPAKPIAPNSPQGSDSAAALASGAAK